MNLVPGPESNQGHGDFQSLLYRLSYPGNGRIKPDSPRLVNQISSIYCRLHNLSSLCRYCALSGKPGGPCGGKRHCQKECWKHVDHREHFTPQMRNPVASSNKPPTALKSAIIDGVVSGNISAAAHASVNWMISNGMLITDTAIPSEQAKIIAVKKSRNDLAIKILGSPVIPSFIARRFRCRWRKTGQ